jgi:hypothetical protein
MTSVNKVDDMGAGRLSVGSCSERLEALEEQSEAEAGAAPPGFDLKQKPVSEMANSRRRAPHNRPRIFIPQTREPRFHT